MDERREQACFIMLNAFVMSNEFVRLSMAIPRAACQISRLRAWKTEFCMPEPRLKRDLVEGLCTIIVALEQIGTRSSAGQLRVTR